ncbi:uncharacterized protein [Lepeophtheirus salmonis]|uniref:uncharacterized protein isoform X1 n=2 Tax=Lepeophtheirus salmonis TaxID=72036 RepID=UPI003AF3EDAB
MALFIFLTVYFLISEVSASVDITNRNFAKSATIWPENTVKYNFGYSFKNENNKELVRAAMEHISSQTCIKFEEHEQPNERNGFLLITEGDQCAANIGYADYTNTGVYNLPSGSLILNTTYCMKFGIVLHELLHMLGALHEHDRPDRKTYIQVLWNNMQAWARPQYYRFPYEGKACVQCPYTLKQNLTNEELNNLDNCCDVSHKGDEFSTYDYESIMHYKKVKRFAIEEKNTFDTLKDVQPDVDIGQLTGMSDLDVIKTNHRYSCPSKKKNCTTKTGNCVFPFKYNGFTHNICTDDYFDYEPWCATKTGPDGSYIKGYWDYCNKDCFECGLSNYMRDSCGGTNNSYSRNVLDNKEFPWQAYLVNKQDRIFICGGVILSTNFILMAASCFNDIQTDPYEVKIKNIFPSDKGYGIFLELKSIDIHPNYTQSPLANDIAIIELVESLAFSDGILPVCLTTPKKHFYADRAATFTHVNDKNVQSYWQMLRMSILKVTSSGCGHNTTNQICAQRMHNFTKEELVSGPLVMKENGRCTVIGISSKASDSSPPSNQIMFTRIDAHLGWIKDKINSQRS